MEPRFKKGDEVWYIENSTPPVIYSAIVQRVDVEEDVDILTSSHLDMDVTYSRTTVEVSRLELSPTPDSNGNVYVKVVKTLSGFEIFTSKKHAEAALKKREDIAAKTDLIFCKLDGECEEEPLDDNPPKEDEGVNLYEVEVHPSVGEKFLSADYNDVDFLGEPVYDEDRRLTINQLCSGESQIRFVREGKIDVEIKVDKCKPLITHEDRRRLGDALYTIQNVLIKENGDKKE